MSWDLTSACNLKCRFCYAAAGSPHPAESRRLAENIIDNICELRPLHLGIGGGDPLLSPHLAWALETICDRMGKDTPSITIDTMMPDKREDIIALARKLNERFGRNQVHFYISIHGLGQIHDSIVGRRGHFHSLMKGVVLFKTYGVPFAIGLVPTRSNLDQIEGVFELSRRLGAGLFNLSQFVPVGRGALDDQNLSIDQYRSLLSWLLEKNKEIGHRYVVTHEHWMGLVDRELFESDLFVGCSAGIYYFGVRSNGDVVPCQLNSYRLGNVTHDRLLDLWKNHPVLKQWRSRQVAGRCNDCPFVYKCGGCRCNAMVYSGDFLGEDPLCPFSRSKIQEMWKQHFNAEPTRPQDGVVHILHSDKAVVTKVVMNATRQGSAIVVRNDLQDSFVRLTGEAIVLFDKIPPSAGITLGSLRDHYLKETGHVFPEAELASLVECGIVNCSE